MARLAIAAAAAACACAAFSADAPEEAAARPPRTVALVVQNHAEPGASIPFMALTDALAAQLAGCDLRVVNPYNSVGVNQNRDARGEETPRVSAMELARRLKADGAVTASVVELRETPPGAPERRFSFRIVLNLADAQTGAIVCGVSAARKSPKYTAAQISLHRADYLSELVYSAAEECADKLKENPLLARWTPTPPPPPPPGPAKPALPRPPETILDRRVDSLVREMLANPQFAKNYDEEKSRRGGRNPVAVIGGVANATGDAGIGPLVASASERFRVKLFNSKLFDVKDDGVLVALARRIIDGGNSPLEDGETMEALKTHGSPGFYVAGELKKLTDLDGVSYFKFRLAMHSLATGRTVWEGIETFTREAKEAK